MEKKKNKKAGSAGSNKDEDDDDDDDDDDDNANKQDAAADEADVGAGVRSGQPKPKASWDYETKTIKAEKDYERALTSLKGTMEVQLKDMQTTLSLFRSMAENQASSQPDLRDRESELTCSFVLSSLSSPSASPVVFPLMERSDDVQGQL